MIPVAAGIWPALPPHRTKRRNVFCGIRKNSRDTLVNCFQWVCRICCETGHDPNKYPKVVKEDAELEISDEVGLAADAESESYDFAKKNDPEDAFISVFQGEHEFRFGGSGGGGKRRVTR